MIPKWKYEASHRLRKALEAPGRVLDRDDVITVLDGLQRLRDDPNRTVEMPLSDANNLDAVVYALGIEDSDTTPAEAVADLHNIVSVCRAEIERLRESAAELSAIKRALDIEDDNGSPVSDVENLLAENERLRGIVKTMDAALTIAEGYLKVGHGTTKVPWQTQYENGVVIGAAREAARQTLDRDLAGGHPNEGESNNDAT